MSAPFPTDDEESVFGLPTQRPAAPAVPPPAAPVPPPPAAAPAYRASNADEVAALFTGPNTPVVAPVAAPAVAPVAPHAPGSMPVTAPAASTPGVQQIDEDDASAAQAVDLDALLAYVVQVGASDLHLSVAAPPMVRLHGHLAAIPNYAPLKPKVLRECIFAALTEDQIKRFEKNKSLDLAYALPGRGRFRMNVYRARKNVQAVMRHIPSEIRPLDQLNMPEVIGTFANLPRGLVLVTGQTGSGKTTTLAGVIDRANRTRQDKILTIEDPIEYVHQHRGCVVDQREVGENEDTDSFEDALRDALRGNPDIILVGEMRDLETTRIALRAAETGHLVFSTLHTQSAQETITRIIEQFPTGEQEHIRVALAGSLKAVVCQTLVPKAEGQGLLAAVEVMVCTPAVANQIREGQVHQIQSSIQQGGREGMQTLNAHLARMVLDGQITYDTGVEHCSNVQDFETLTGGRSRASAAAVARTQQERALGAMGSL